jgi:Putative beta-barrel porin-2, OmpL-like. bbp2
LDKEASTFGGAVLAKYSFTPKFSLAGRGEYIASHGDAGSGAPNLLYGDGSKAWSLTLTPTWQEKIFFVRGEVSYTAVVDAAPGFAFGSAGTAKSQTRGMIETGFLF